MLDWMWDARFGELLMQIRRDSNHDGEVSDIDGFDVVSVKVPGAAEGTPVVQPDVLKQLQRVVE